MITMNRYYSLYSDRLESALYENYEWGFNSMRSDKAGKNEELFKE